MNCEGKMLVYIIRGGIMDLRICLYLTYALCYGVLFGKFAS